MCGTFRVIDASTFHSSMAWMVVVTIATKTRIPDIMTSCINWNYARFLFLVLDHSEFAVTYAPHVPRPKTTPCLSLYPEVCQTPRYLTSATKHEMTTLSPHLKILWAFDRDSFADERCKLLFRGYGLDCELYETPLMNFGYMQRTSLNILVAVSLMTIWQKKEVVKGGRYRASYAERQH